jgi:cysteinyl-tRNA synthetase
MLRLHDTRAKKKIELVPREEGKVGIYVCGITVYDFCHVGHARTNIAFDVIVRRLRQRGFDVRFVRNVTDIDDKIIRRAAAEGTTAAQIAETYTRAMNEDFAALGIAPADEEPRATTHVAEVLSIIQRLIDRGLAYAAGGDVYYSVPSFPSYGSLSGQSIDELKSGARIEVDEHKHSPLDFALWKGAKPGEPAWESPWGPGRPGWHIECSAMSHRYLGETFDLHGGGSDLIFPHHENENAQSQGAFGTETFARHWMHSGMVNFGGEKMSKSLGNVVTIRKIAETHDLEALRLLMIGVHYRSPVSFEIGRDAAGAVCYPDLDEAETRLDYFYRTLERLDAHAATVSAPPSPPPSELAVRYQEAMDDDFNTAAVIGHLYDAAVQANKLLDDPKSAPKDVRTASLVAARRDIRLVGDTLGILRRPDFLLARRGRLCQRRQIDPATVESRIAERATARATKDFQRADEIRKALKSESIELMDGPQGTTWRVI